MQNVNDEFAGATAVSIVVDSSSKQQQLRMAVSALVPRKRTHAEDPIQHTLKHYVFWDDKRYCTHLDSLLTRLAPLSVVHLGSTERAEVCDENVICMGFSFFILTTKLHFIPIDPIVKESFFGCCPQGSASGVSS